MDENDLSQFVCSTCNNQGLYADDDGHFYCINCNSQAQDVFDKDNADEDFIQGTGIYSAAHSRHVPLSSSAPVDHLGPTEPADFGTVPVGVVFKEKDYYNTLRMRYVLGIQLMIQLQCEALVEKCGVTPLICGIASSIWLRFVASTRVLDDGWADHIVLESEKGERRYQVGSKHVNEPRNMYNERLVVIWLRSLKKSIPLSCSLAVSYLACHIAREPVLPTDITKWAIEGKLPYFGAFPKIAASIREFERCNQHVAVVCPMKASSMFRPSQLPMQKLESMAAAIGQSVGLSLPPVNFYGIACRFLKQLSLPVEKIIPYVCRIQEWSMPPDLWLSSSEEKFPSRVCVMSILIVTIRILYNLNGFGKWEKSLSAASFAKSNARKGDEELSKSLGGESGASSSSVHKFASDSMGLLRNLEKKYDDLSDKYEYSKDLPTYLQYCKDVVFAGVEPVYRDPTLIEELWSFYEKNREDNKSAREFETESISKRSRDNDILFCTPSLDSKKHRDEKVTGSSSTCNQFLFRNYIPKLDPDSDTTNKRDNNRLFSAPLKDIKKHLCDDFITSQSTSSGFKFQKNNPEWDPDVDYTLQKSNASRGTATSLNDEAPSQSLENIAIKHLKIDMEENRFCYIPPRVEIKRLDHLHYERKRGDGSYHYVAHADYYILLRACAKVAKVDVRILHVGVLSLEKRLEFIEKEIDRNLLGKCSDGSVEDGDDVDGESIDIANLNL